MAATRANLEEVLTPDAYRHLDHLNDRILAGCTRVIEKYNLPGYAVGVGSKGCVTFSPSKIVDYETFKANQDKDLCELAWLFNMNRGIFMTPGREEEWTLSVTHTDESVDAYVAVFDEMAEELTKYAARCARRARGAARSLTTAPGPTPDSRSQGPRRSRRGRAAAAGQPIGDDWATCRPRTGGRRCRQPQDCEGPCRHSSGPRRGQARHRRSSPPACAPRARRRGTEQHAGEPTARRRPPCR